MKLRPHQAKGRIVSRISRADYFFDGKPDDEHAGPVEFEFTDGSTLQINIEPDGNSVRYSWLPIRFPDPARGEEGWKRVVLTDSEPYSVLIGQQVTAVDVLRFRSVGEGISWISTSVPAGYGFKFGNGHTLAYFNCWDDAKIVLDDDPWQLRDEYGLEDGYAWKSGNVFDVASSRWPIW